MGETPTKKILAVVTLNMESVSGGAPIFFARDEEEQEKIVRYISNVLDAMVHDLENGTYIVVKH